MVRLATQRGRAIETLKKLAMPAPRVVVAARLKRHLGRKYFTQERLYYAAMHRLSSRYGHGDELALAPHRG